jgi:hypothetical protein
LRFTGRRLHAACVFDRKHLLIAGFCLFDLTTAGPFGMFHPTTPTVYPLLGKDNAVWRRWRGSGRAR